MESGGFQDKGCPETLNHEQQQQILQYVKDCDTKLIPLTQVALLEWVNLTFSTEFSPTWLSSYIRSQDSLNIVDGEALEQPRAEISEEGLRENAKILSEKP